ncbi:MaoC family dehydratase [Microbaculum marinum]|uniref:MaoC family dehydratase n=2 Tax=Microbaculum marinum TaxID=1764581 RepID=A0AAW9RUX2_9HYPH
MPGPTPPEKLTVDAVNALVGQPLAPSRWRVIDQAMIDDFADLINDHQYIHVDPVRARASPFGGTVAHGFLSLSIFGGLAAEIAPKLENGQMSVNYGFDRIRFAAPVREGAEVRTVLTLKAVEAQGSGVVNLLYDAVLEIRGEGKPAIVAEWRVRHYLQGEAAGLGA